MHLLPSHENGCCHGDAANLKLNRSFCIAVVLNTLLVIGEAGCGLWSGSMALLADAGHNLSDVAGLILAWWAHWLRGKSAGGRWTYGKRSFTILAANVNALLIIVAIVGVAVESVRRMFAPSEVLEMPVIFVALFAAVLNFATARLLAGGRDDLNVRGAYLHMLTDAAVSLAVVVGAVLMMFTDWHWVDPGLSIAICFVLAFGTWELLRESTSMMMNAAPRKLDVVEVREFLESTPGVEEVADLHIWSVSTVDVALTARLLCPECTAEQQDQLLAQLHHDLDHEFGISHRTIEVQRGQHQDMGCSLEADSQHEHHHS
ncbi:MAG: cation diffusion facilitator family transporter [Planctomycetota bacterium]